MDNLPVDILQSILSRLSIESVSPSRRVSKTWRTIMGNKVGLLFAFTSTSTDLQLHYGEDDYPHGTEEIDDFRKTLTKLDCGKALMPHLDNGRSMFGSCNGVVCFKAMNPMTHVCFICNPMTGESIRVPGFRDRRTDLTLCGFGYVPSTNKYKVVAESKQCLYVYTLERRSREWRVIGKFPELLFRDRSSIFLNGALHWLYEARPGDEHVIVFDLAEEKFRPNILLPSDGYRQDSGLDSHNYYQLLLLGANLCYVFTDAELKYLDIWMFKKAMNDNASDSTHGEGHQRGCYYDNSWSWSKFTTISWDNRWDQYMPFAITKSNIVLLWQMERYLCTYDPKTSTLKKLWDSHHIGKDVQVIPHMNTSVSLKDFGQVLLKLW